MRNILQYAIGCLSSLFLISCNDKAPEVPPIHEMIKDELREYVQQTTTDLMSIETMPEVELVGPEITIEENAAAGLVKAHIVWKQVFMEQLYYALPKATLQTGEYTYEVLAPEVAAGEAAIIFTSNAFFSISDEIPLLTKEIGAPEEVVNAYSLNQGYLPDTLESFGEYAVILDSDKYKELRVEAETFAEKQAEEQRKREKIEQEEKLKRDKIAEQERSVREKEQAKVRAEKIKAFLDYVDGRVFSSSITVATTDDRWSVDFRSFETKGSLGDPLVTFHTVPYHKGKPSTYAPDTNKFEGKFDALGNLNVTGMTSGSRGPKFISEKGYPITFRHDIEKGVLEFDAKYKKYEYKGELYPNK